MASHGEGTWGWCAATCLSLAMSCGGGNDNGGTPSATGGAGGATADAAAAGQGGASGAPEARADAASDAAQDGPGAGEACDVYAQDCADPAAPKCTLDFSGRVDMPTVCDKPLGKQQLGESCRHALLQPAQLRQDLRVTGRMRERRDLRCAERRRRRSAPARRPTDRGLRRTHLRLPGYGDVPREGAARDTAPDRQARLLDMATEWKPTFVATWDRVTKLDRFDLA